MNIDIKLDLQIYGSLFNPDDFWHTNLEKGANLDRIL